ncbi:MAG TPA: hypothetical protein VGS07_13620 [Thermoanaerobaculia bacterium]|jgi:hypothetical protein|nr:hypothetical protein [Thermoanaerobaculia bacterium]
MASKTGLNAEIRDLYRLPPEEFTAARNALASRLGKEKRKDDAAEVKSLPKPTPSAWAVNALFDRQEQKMDALIAAGKRARSAQKEAVAGKGAESLREAIRLARGLADELRWDAAQILSEGGRPPGRDLVERIAANLQAIAFSPAAAEQVARGWLDRDLDPPGFEVLAGLQVAASPVVDIASRRLPPEKKVKEKAKEKDERAPARRKKKVLPMPRPPARDAREIAKDKARAAEEAKRLEAAEEARREKEAEVQRRRIAVAEEKVERARAEADPLREEADRLAAEAAEAKRAAEKAEHAAARALEKADRAAERLAAAQEALEQIR